MNHHRAAALLERQHRLLLRSTELRGRLAADAVVLRRPLALADRVREGWRWLRAHPEVPLAALVVVAVLRPRRAWRWGCGRGRVGSRCAGCSAACNGFADAGRVRPHAAPAGKAAGALRYRRRHGRVQFLLARLRDLRHRAAARSPGAVRRRAHRCRAERDRRAGDVVLPPGARLPARPRERACSPASCRSRHCSRACPSTSSPRASKPNWRATAPWAWATTASASTTR